MTVGWKWALGTVALLVAVGGCNAPANDAAWCAPGRVSSVDSDYFGRLDIPPLPTLSVREGEIRDGFEAAGFTFSPDEWRESGGGNTVFTTGHYPVREDPDAEMLRIVGTLGSDCPTGLGHIALAEGTSYDLGMRNAHRLLLLLLTLPEWDGASEWLNAALPTAHRTGLAETTVQGTTVKLLYETRDGVDLYILTLHRPLDDSARQVPTPAAASVDCPTPLEANYFREVSAGIQAQTALLGSFRDRVRELRANPSLEYDVEWLAQMTYTLIELRFGAIDLAKLDGPESTTEIQQELMLRAEAMEKFVNAWQSFVDTGFSTRLADGNAALEEVTWLTRRVGERSDAFCEPATSGRGVPPGEIPGAIFVVQSAQI